MDDSFSWDTDSAARDPMYEKTKASHNSDSVRMGRNITLAGLAINGFLVVMKFLAGWFGKSQALIADAVHSFSDLATDVVVLLGLQVGRKEPDESHHFGHARLETLASGFVGFALIATAVYIGIDSGINIHEHTEYYPNRLALIGAILSIVLKEVLYQYTVYVGKRIKSNLIIANAWHHRSDALSSVAVLLGVIGSMIRPQWHILDSYAALLVSFFIIKVGLETIRDSLREFTDTAPDSEVIKQIEKCILETDGVLDMHDLRVRTSGGLYQMETHIVVDAHLSVVQGHRIAKDVERCLKDDFKDVDRLIVHVDPKE